MHKHYYCSLAVLLMSNANQILAGGVCSSMKRPDPTKIMPVRSTTSNTTGTQRTTRTPRTSTSKAAVTPMAIIAHASATSHIASRDDIRQARRLVIASGSGSAGSGRVSEDFEKFVASIMPKQPELSTVDITRILDNRDQEQRNQLQRISALSRLAHAPTDTESN